MSKVQADIIAAAVRDALAAPSVFNTQPWRWRIDEAMVELRADRDRRLEVVDPVGRLSLLSCGVALHHATTALAASGCEWTVRRLVTGFDDEVLARVFVTGAHEVTAEDRALYGAIARRRTDRRPFGDEPVRDEAVSRLVAAAESHGARLHRVRVDQMPMLAIAVATAGATELADPDYRGELSRWSNRPPWSGDGVPVETAVARVPRRVPVREFALPPREGMAVEPGGDRGSVYCVLYGDAEAAVDWLRAGEALSAVLLTAVTLGLSAAPISDVIEVEHPRSLVRGLLPDAGYPFVVVRFGFGTSADDLSPTPRRDAVETIDGLPLS